MKNRRKCLTSFPTRGTLLSPSKGQSGTLHENRYIFLSYLPISNWIRQYRVWALLYVVIAVNSQQPSPEECNRPWFGRKGGPPRCVRCRTGTREDHLLFQPRASTIQYFRYPDGSYTGQALLHPCEYVSPSGIFISISSISITGQVYGRRLCGASHCLSWKSMVDD